ncbi:MAG TPA: 6-phosphogluconolactonase, partial [Gaiellaceae bacterium]|nr:6-phosphogluconolactonase [Gaiellaceae bacterium]
MAEGRDIELVVAADAEGAARIVAQRLAEAARRGGHVVLTGGTTPQRAYELAAELEQDWSRVELWWGDERCVPAGDERSNYRMARVALIEQVAVGPAAVHRMRGELGRDAGALRYEEELGSLRRFDLMLLGLGPDGHVA